METNSKGRITEGTGIWRMAWPLIRALLPSRLWSSFVFTCSMDPTMLMHCFNLGRLSLETHVFSSSKYEVLPSVAFSVTDVLQWCFSWLQTHSFPVPEWSSWCPRVCFLWEQVFTGISPKKVGRYNPFVLKWPRLNSGSPLPGQGYSFQRSARHLLLYMDALSLCLWKALPERDLRALSFQNLLPRLLHFHCWPQFHRSLCKDKEFQNDCHSSKETRFPGRPPVWSCTS